MTAVAVVVTHVRVDDKGAAPATAHGVPSAAGRGAPPLQATAARSGSAVPRHCCLWKLVPVVVPAAARAVAALTASAAVAQKSRPHAP